MSTVWVIFFYDADKNGHVSASTAHVPHVLVYIANIPQYLL